MVVVVWYRWSVRRNSKVVYTACEYLSLVANRGINQRNGVCDGGWYGYARHGGWLLNMLHSAARQDSRAQMQREIRASKTGQAILTKVKSGLTEGCAEVEQHEKDCRRERLFESRTQPGSLTCNILEIYMSVENLT